MHVENHKFYSRHLGREMEFRSYGHAGKPMLVFPAGGERFDDYEKHGMVDAMGHMINGGLLHVFAVDSIDRESWIADGLDPEEKAIRHNTYDAYIVDELVPYIRDYTSYYGALITTGCSMGGFHSLNFFLRHPDVFDTVIALSGVYDARNFVGEHFGYNVYVNSPIDYLKNIEDPWYLEKYRVNDIIICSGQGANEETSVRETRLMGEILRQKQIPAWVDFWGYEVGHDWEWWKSQIVYFLERLFEFRNYV
jgi:esterase/lipase superfamily enzyme